MTQSFIFFPSHHFRRQVRQLFAALAVALFGLLCQQVGAAPQSELNMKTSNNVKNTRFEKPYPFSAEEFWGKILLLLQEKVGGISKERFEEVFGVTTWREIQEGDTSLFFLYAGKTWFFDAALTFFGDDIPNVRSKTGLIMHWGAAFEPERCIGRESARKGLQSIGWIFGFRDPYGSSFDTFSSRGGIDRLYLDALGDCVSGIRVSVGR